jgi:hypothetical protein
MAERIKAGGKLPKLRVSAKVRVAIEKMVDHALTRQEAAKVAGLTDHALYCALRKPHVQAYRHERMEVLRSSEASRTIARAAKLADGSESDHVKMAANVWLAGIDGLSPVARSESLHIHQGITPGLTVNFIQAAPTEPLVIEQPVAPRLASAAGLPVRVPHPSERLK